MRIKMHSLEEVGASVPAFLAKLWKIVEDPETNDLIRWSAEGASFIIQNTARFSRELLPLYYKHSNMASFIRQLNMYGFHKVVSLEAGGLKVDKDEMEFAHPCFVHDHPVLLENIKRKIPNKLEGELRLGARSDVYGKVLTEVKNMKGRQESLDSQLVSMKRENEVLWREVALLREKHKQQQTIVNKLVHFFVNLFQADEAGNLRLKRQARLMIKDKTHSAAKVAKLDGFRSRRGCSGTVVPTVGDADDFLRLGEEEDCDGMDDRSPQGPIIHEIDASELLDGYSTVEMSEEESTMLPQDLCEVVKSSPAASPSSSRHKGDGGPGDMLLDVCPDITVSSLPLDIDTVIAEATDTEPRAPAGRAREPKRRRRRRPAPARLATQQDDGLTIILPLEEAVDDVQPVEVIVPEPRQPEEEAAPPAPPAAVASLDRWGVTEQLDSHVGSVQSELDNIRELLKCEGYSLDDSTLMGVRAADQGLAPDVFTKIFSDDPLSYELSELPSGVESAGDRGKENLEFSSDPLITGSELISSGSNGLPELTDFLDWSQVSEAPGDYELILGDLNTPQMVPGSPGVSK